VFVRHENVERFIAEVRGDDPELAVYLQIEARFGLSRCFPQ
jgi:hypothetical protein